LCPGAGLGDGHVVHAHGGAHHAISLIAMNVEHGVQRLVRPRATPDRFFARTPRVRVLHALLFEVGLAAVTVPLTAWWLGIGLWPAFLLDASLLLFFLPYSVAFNWAYERAARTLGFAPDGGPTGLKVKARSTV